MVFFHQTLCKFIHTEAGFPLDHDMGQTSLVPIIQTHLIPRLSPPRPLPPRNLRRLVGVIVICVFLNPRWRLKSLKHPKFPIWDNIGILLIPPDVQRRIEAQMTSVWGGTCLPRQIGNVMYTYPWTVYLDKFVE